MIRSFCMYMYVFVQPLLYLTKCILQRGVFVSVYSYIGVWRYHLFNKHDKTLRFSYLPMAPWRIGIKNNYQNKLFILKTNHDYD